MSRISVIVAVYNAEKYLAQCLESLVSQTYRDLEIILTDDGSSDLSGEICDRYALSDPRIRVIHQKNAGVCAARNAGLARATGEYVIFGDSDDWFETNALEVLMEAAEEYAADMVYGDMVHIKGEKRNRVTVFSREFAESGKEICRRLQMACIGYGYNPYRPDRLVVSGLGSVGNKLYRMRLIRDNALRFDDYTNNIYEDNLFTIRYLDYADRVCYRQVPVYDYRLTNASSIHRFRPEAPETSRRIFERITAFIGTLEREWQEGMVKAFYVFVIRRLSEELRIYYFHRQNRASLQERIRELQDTIESPPYKDAIEQVDMSRLLTAHKYTCRSAKSGSAQKMYSAYKIRNILKRFI